MNITINKDTSIKELIEYLEKSNSKIPFNPNFINSMKQNFNVVGDLYLTTYIKLKKMPGVSDRFITRVGMIFLLYDKDNFRQTFLYDSLIDKELNYSVLNHWEHRGKFWTWLEQKINPTNNPLIFIHPKFSHFLEFLDQMDNRSKQETSTTKQSEQPDDKSFRLIQKLLEIWNDDVKQQVEDIINQSR